MPRARIDAVIFDLDGTLVDTLHDIADAMNHVLAERGLATHGPQEYRGWIGEGVVRLAERALPKDRLELVPGIVAEFRQQYHAHLLDRSLPYPGIRELLRELVTRRLPLCVLSNKPDQPTRKIVRALFADVPFTQVVGERPNKPRKPDPSVAFELARQIGVRPAHCGLVGDTRIDMSTAGNAGMVAIGVRWGFHDASELLAHGAQVLLDRPEALLSQLEAPVSY